MAKKKKRALAKGDIFEEHNTGDGYTVERMGGKRVFSTDGSVWGLCVTFSGLFNRL